MTSDSVALPSIAVPLVRLTKDAAPRTVLTSGGLTFKAQVITDPIDPIETQFLLTLASNEDGTRYSSVMPNYGTQQVVDVASGDVIVLAYSTMQWGTGFFGGIGASVAKSSGTVLNATLGFGIRAFGADGVFCGSFV